MSRKYVDFAEFGVVPKIGRLPRVYFLTERGAKYLAEAWRTDPKAVNYPKGVKLFSRDYFHRAATIDFHIELRLFAERNGLTVEFFHSYFDTTGANRSESPEDRLQRLPKFRLRRGFSSRTGSSPSTRRTTAATSTPLRSTTASTPSASTGRWKST